jgi:hypothetical protein
MSMDRASTNYEANTIQWKRGDQVLHDADAKETRMLMVVIGYTRDGLCKTQYADGRHHRRIYTNVIADLHDPARFRIEVKKRQGGKET